MKNLIGIKNEKSISLFLGLVAFFVLFAPDLARADITECLGMTIDPENGVTIFTIMACKVTTTLADVRRIIYVLAGFGLIAFTFAAIFNKISFKHLANIGLSLFLLAMLTPFIEYFTQKPGGKLQFGHYLDPNSDRTAVDMSVQTQGLDYSITSSPVVAVEGKGITTYISSDGSTPTTIKSDGGVIKVYESKGLSYNITDGQVEDLNKDEGKGGLLGKLDKLDKLTGPNGLNVAGITIPDKLTAPAGISPPGEEKKTGWQKIKDEFGKTFAKDSDASLLDKVKLVVKTGTEAVQAGSTAISTVKYVKDQSETAIGAIKNADDIQQVFNAVKNGSNNVQNINDAYNQTANMYDRMYGYGERDEKSAKKRSDINNKASDTGNIAGEANQGVGAARQAGGWGKDIKDIFK